VNGPAAVGVPMDVCASADHLDDRPREKTQSKSDEHPGGDLAASRFNAFELEHRSAEGDSNYTQYYGTRHMT